MITEALLRILQWVLQILHTLLPEWTPEIPDGIGDVMQFLLAFDAVLPVSETLSVAAISVGAVGAFVGLKWLIKLVDWIMDVIP